MNLSVLPALIVLVASLVSAADPGPRLGHVLVYDEGLRRVVLLDGHWPPRSGAAGNVWAWNGQRWETISATAPPTTSMSAAAFDSRRRRLVKYAGVERGVALGGLWELDARGSRSIADTSAGARFHHGMAYDSAHERTVMYGGATSGRWDTTTWLWDGARWTRLDVPGPGPRAAFRMVYDSRRREVVLFGGVAESQTFLNDTWVWNGTSWMSELLLSSLRAARERQGDSEADRTSHPTVFVGGVRSRLTAEFWTLMTK